ncbi:hypothetical protein BOTBODRAFT_217813 [Botryobasidium botryosum FD-172 SS1]|uniref:Altered inheritance of mitochondria protein 41 n=1 Tax=Botryobasidium botryosum (strain FD-172 SS1) TaxID=930990 RepID=A0A067N269_BOTB1|nr:hypothetical protein BOTBODRAFT_217813 [Botryobasidium botryosum FD-172 SS1]
MNCLALQSRAAYAACHGLRLQGRAAFHQTRTLGQADLRARLKDELKTAMKARDSFSSTVIRSVIAEVTNADKASSSAPVDDSSIVSLIRKAIARRNDAASQFRAASRTDLADKEDAEVALLTKFVPAQLSESDIEAHLTELITSIKSEVGSKLPEGAVVGKVLKAFFEKVDKSLVQGDVVSRKAKELLKTV